MINIKKILVLLLILFCFSSAYSQKDLIDAITELTLEKDSLERQVIKPLNDSITGLIFSHKKENSELRAWRSKHKLKEIYLEKDNQALKSKLIELEKNKVKDERDTLQAQFDLEKNRADSLDTLVVQKDLLIADEEERGARKSIQEKEEGRQEVLNRIIQTYQEQPFDDLIKSFTLNTVERDMLIVGDKIEEHQTLMKLKKYFKSEQVLNEKFNELKVEIALAQILSLEQTELVKGLAVKIENYKSRNLALIRTINEILEIDKSLNGNDNSIKDKKRAKVWMKLSWFIRHYRFNFSDYPYLTERVIDIIDQKEKNPNTDITYLLDEL